ncbi:ABC transporter family substrate-binding protein [Corynebacterium sp. ES2794-CONJ1]|uniref:ABC transporter family substrate-binding protein n=1 Tax=unclassified Corynebacterium TaxID=2624378 RepID=UPI002166C52B|nr:MULTISPECIES: ABC transporter family substrate-binding protein [unclassified Corynebacterium]MCS4489656.1 ABC transporter family substrate-binding protein [Corynebacterium sp. ES2775-CONJ]MCS4491335.1 ABC transporter family substrate-binding protein [Corynebacterium sp. ES2715-CONJ3]MCS4531568.1 ABC transporter family substrate-binding protein [Corynebacterium sp. ES2730-CONJ]MCU9518964.1 ABC transporter family substrate-binding protein [Corynebacterium sp. ES2794-CONJ1]
MKKNIRIATMAALSVAALTLGACADGATTGTGSQSASGQGSAEFEIKAAGDYNPLERDQIKDGGELVLPISEIPEQLNRFHGNSSADTTRIWRYFNPQIALFDGDGTWHANPAYLTDVKDDIVDGNLVLTWDIHPDATFNDGTPIDWTAFENTWKMNNGSNPQVVPSGTDGYERISAVTRGDDDKQVIITFDGTYPWWQGLFNSILHPKVNDPATFNESYINTLHPEWGAGPFIVDSFDPNANTVTFVRNDKWWGETAKLEKLTLRAMENLATINAFKAGEIDAAGVSSKDNLATARGLGDAIDIRSSVLTSNALMMLNAQAPQLGDIKVREAIVKGIDRALISEIRFNGLDYTEELPGSLTYFTFQPGYEDNFSSVGAFDPEKSQALLDEAGWVAGSDGIREKDGQKFSIRYTMLGDSAIDKAFASALQKMMKDIGVDLSIQERPSSDFSKIMAAKDFDLFFLSFRSSDPFGAAYFGQLYNTDSELNISGTGSAELDAKIDKLQKLPTAEEQIKEANKLEEEAFATYGVVPMYNGPQMVGVKKGLANFGATAFADLPVENIGWAK